MPGEERYLVRRVRSLSRLFLKLLHSTYNQFLLTSPVFTFPLPPESQYHQLKTFLTEISIREREWVTVEEVLEEASKVLGQRTVEMVRNNVSSPDWLEELLEPEEL